MNRIKHRKMAKRQLLLIKAALIFVLIFTFLVMFLAVCQAAFFDLNYNASAFLFFLALGTQLTAVKLGTEIGCFY